LYYLGFLILNLNRHILNVQLDCKDTKRKGLRWENSYKKEDYITTIVSKNDKITIFKERIA
jgi:hypothetical protein